MCGLEIVPVCLSALADLVDVAGEVEHLVGEAPLVRRKQASFVIKPLKPTL